MFELILSTIRDSLQKCKSEIIKELIINTSRENAEIRCDLLEIKQMIRKLKSNQNKKELFTNN